MSTYPYVSPTFIDEGSEELIHMRMLATIPNDVDKTEGGFVWDSTRPAAIELAQAYQALNNTLQLMFPMFSYSYWLDLHGLTRSIVRKEAVAAAGYVNVTGIANTVVPEGFQFASPTDSDDTNVIFVVTEDTVLVAYTASGEVTFTGTAGRSIPEGTRVAVATYETDDEDNPVLISVDKYYRTTERAVVGSDGTVTVPVEAEEIGDVGNTDAGTINHLVTILAGINSVTNAEAISGGSDGKADVPVEAEEAGTNGNVPAGAVTLMVKPMKGITGINNNEPITGGTDEESDDDLRDRIVVRDMSEEESFVGSMSDYKRWAMSVSGVGGVIVIPLYAGPGTTKICIVDEDNQPANDALLKKVIDYILSPDDPEARLAPVDAGEGGILICAPDNVAVNVSCSVKLAIGYTVDDAVAAFKKALNSYLLTCPDDGEVRYYQVGAILIDLVEVDDYKDLLVNGGTSNISIAQDEIPSAGTIEAVSYV